MNLIKAEKALKNQEKNNTKDCIPTCKDITNRFQKQAFLVINKAKALKMRPNNLTNSKINGATYINKTPCLSIKLMWVNLLFEILCAVKMNLRSYILPSK